jgi:hypothetical protein
MKYLLLLLFSFQAHAVFNWNQGFVPKFDSKITSSLKTKSQVLKFVQDEFTNIKGLKLIEVKYFNNMPAPIVEDQHGNRYRALFGDWIHTDYVATKILTYMGAKLSPKKIFKNLKISFNNQSEISFFRFWNDSPIVLKREDSFSHGSTGWTIKKVLLQKIDNNEFSIEDNFLPLAFIQNGEPTAQDFRYSLGHSLTHSTPNMYRPYFFNKKVINQLDIVIRSKEMEEASISLNKEDFEAFASTLLAMDFNIIRGFFNEAGYPSSLTELYIRKMQERAADFLSRGKIKYPLGKSSLSFSWMPYVKNGEVIENYPHFKVDLTETVIENLMVSVGSKVWEESKSILAHILASTPYSGKDFKIFGNNIGIGPSATLRFERKIIDNKNAIGIDDLFLVNDVITIGLVVGVGVEADTIIGSGWARVGPGYHRNLNYQRKASSYQEALDLPWVKSFTKVLKPNFEKIKVGESLSVKNSIMLGLLSGGNHKVAGLGLARAGGYIIAGGNYSWGTQINRAEDGRLTLLSGKEKTVSASTKIYLRTLNRFFRIPIFQSSINGGKSDIAAFYIDPAEYSSLNYLDRISQDEAMYLALTSGLTTEIGNSFKSIEISDDFYSRGVRYNLFRWKGHYKDLETSRTYTEENKEKHFYISKEERSHEVSNNYERCDVIGVIEYKTKKEIEIQDKGLSIKCALKLQGPDHSLKQRKINRLTSSFDLEKTQLETPHNTNELTNPKSIVTIRSFINSDNLGELFAIGSERSHPIHDKILDQLDTLKIPFRATAFFFYTTLAGIDSLQEKLDYIVHELRINGSSNALRPIILSLFSPSTEVQYQRQGQAETSTSFGPPFKLGSSLNYINTLDDMLGPIHIRSF